MNREAIMPTPPRLTRVQTARLLRVVVTTTDRLLREGSRLDLPVECRMLLLREAHELDAVLRFLRVR